MTDMIVYTVVTEPGGQDGMDPTDKGGHVTLAVFEKGLAVNKIGKDTRLKLVPIVVDPDEIKAAIHAKLTPVERLFHKFEAQRPPVKREHDGRGPG